MRNPATGPLPAEAIFSRARRVTWTAGVLICSISLLAILGWLLHLRALTSFLPDRPEMRWNTATALFAAGLSLLLAVAERHRSWRPYRRALRIGSITLACWPLAYGSLVLFEYVSGKDLLIEQFLGPAATQLAGPKAARATRGAAVCLVLASFSLLSWRFRRGFLFFVSCALGIAILGWLGFSDFIYPVLDPEIATTFGPFSLPSALSFLALATGLLALRPREGVVRILTSRHHAGRLTRRLVPVAVLLTLTLGVWRLWAERRWHVSQELGVALYGTGMLICLLAYALRSAWWMDRVDRRRRQSEQKIARSLETMERALTRANAFFEFAPGGMLVVDDQGLISMANSEVERIFGWTRADLIGQSVEVLLPEGMSDRHVGHRAAFAKHPETRAMASGRELLGRRRDGSTFAIDVSLSPWQTDTGPMVIASIRDVSEQEAAARALRESEERFRGAIENSVIGMALVALDGGWLEVNRALCAMLGRTEEELLASAFQDITYPEDLDGDMANVRSLLAGEIGYYQMEKRYFHKNGSIIWAMLAVTLVRSAEGRPMHFVSQIEDITERHHAEERLRASLEEKETLLKEVHHRVKNNLQIISSFLQLQSEGLEDPSLLIRFREAQDRVRAMALIHEGIYRSGDLAAVDFGAHLRELVESLVRSYGHSTNPVQFIAETDKVSLDIDLAVPLSLIVNELVTNSFKHAFCDGKGGVLRLVFRNSEKDHLLLAVSDDGPGYSPESVSPDSLGLKVVRTLVRQIRGQMEVHTSPGTTFSITVPKSGRPAEKST